VIWARVKEATKRGSVGDLLADEVQPGGPRLLAKHPCRKDSEEEAEVEEMGDAEEQTE